MLNKRILILVFVVAFLTLLAGCLAPTPPIEENRAPIITSDPVKTAKVGVDYTYHVKATDPDEDDLEYSLTVSPKSMTINSTTGIINWDPQIRDVGYHEVIVIASDGDLSVVQSFTIIVSKPTPTPIPTKYYIITATAGDGGSISPSGKVKVKRCSDKLFTITPDANYYITDVLVDGDSVGAVDSYTFDNVRKNHTIHATFKAVELIEIKVEPDEVTLLYRVTLTEITQQLEVTAYYSDGSALDITSDCIYVLDNGDVVTVMPNGRIVAEGFGETTITVTYKGKENIVDVTVIGRVHNINKPKYYHTIQAAIDDADPGDTILVAEGIYKESLEINKCLTLVSTEGPENTTILSPSGTGILIRAACSGVTVEGFKVSGDYLHYGIIVRKGVGVNILNNVVTGTTKQGAILLWGDLVETTVSGNVIDNCAYGIVVGGPGWSISNCMISDNTIVNSTGGDWGANPSLGKSQTLLLMETRFPTMKV